MPGMGSQILENLPHESGNIGDVEHNQIIFYGFACFHLTGLRSYLYDFELLFIRVNFIDSAGNQRPPAKRRGCGWPLEGAGPTRIFFISIHNS